MTATVGDCELTQAAWNAAIAVAGGGEVWEDSGLRWSWQAHDGQLMLSFPRVIDEAAARRGVEVAHDRGACIVGAWLAADVEASPLEAVGFERGWEPWWMTAPLDAIPDNGDDRVTISAGVPEYGPEGQRLLTMARGPDARTWHALARVDGRFAGRAWSFAPGPIAGIFDMFVVASFSAGVWDARCCEQSAPRRAHTAPARRCSTPRRMASASTPLRAFGGSAPASPTGITSPAPCAASVATDADGHRLLTLPT